MKPDKRKQFDPLKRAIAAREAVIDRAELRIKKVYADAEEEANRIRKDIQKKKILLDALKRGQLKP